MKHTLSIALFLFATTAQAATIDVPRIDGWAELPTTGAPLKMEIDLDASAATCEAQAAEYNDGFQESERKAAAALNLTNYEVKTSIFCHHRYVTVPDGPAKIGVCSEKISDTTTYDEIMALCPILQQ